MAIPRYRSYTGPVLFSAGFRPFFLAASIWAAIAIPLWLHIYGGGPMPPTVLPPLLWHAHAMIYGYAEAVVAGFLLTSIPNWTGRMPLQGGPLALLVGLWLIGRLADLFSAMVGPPLSAGADLAFLIVFLAVVAREIIAGKNWRNLPMLGVLALLLTGNVLVHLQVLGLADTGQLGERIGIATLLELIALVGGRIVPSFTRNWLTKNRPEVPSPASAGSFDLAALIVTGLGVAAWAVAPDTPIASYMLIAAGLAAGARLTRWRGLYTTRELLLLDLHIGYAWLAFGLLFLGLDGIYQFMPTTSALHAVTVGAIGTMTLAVMTRASLGHTGRPLTAGRITIAIYSLISLAAVLRLLVPFTPDQTMIVLSLAGSAWSAAFLLFAVFYGRALSRSRVSGESAKPI